MRRLAIVALLALACGGSDGGTSGPACTAGALRCSNYEKQRCWDPNGAGDVQWQKVSDCIALDSVTLAPHFEACLACADGTLACQSDTLPCSHHGGIVP